VSVGWGIGVEVGVSSGGMVSVARGVHVGVKVCVGARLVSVGNRANVISPGFCSTHKARMAKKITIPIKDIDARGDCFSSSVCSIYPRLSVLVSPSFSSDFDVSPKLVTLPEWNSSSDSAELPTWTNGVKQTLQDLSSTPTTLSQFGQRETSGWSSWFDELLSDCVDIAL